MVNPRTPRDVETREKSARYVYQPPSTLPDPTPEPGYGYRWIATAINGQPYAANVSTRIREGWEPVKAADHPELMLPANSAGNVEIGGLMLCKMPVEKIQARNEFYGVKSEQQVESVDNTLMRQSDARMPLFNERKSTTTFGTGNK